MSLKASRGCGQIVASKPVKENMAARSMIESFRGGNDDGNLVDAKDDCGGNCDDEEEEQRAVVDDGAG